MATTDSSPDRGNLVITVEMPPLCSTTTRPGRPSSSSAILTHKITSLFSKLNILDTRQLCIDKGRAAWAVYVDIYILDADGSLLDACLLAAVAALSSLQLKPVEVDDRGNVVNKTNNTMDEDSSDNNSRGRIQLSMQPSSLTCGLYINNNNTTDSNGTSEDHLLVDLTSEEEGLVDCVIETTMNERGEMLAMEKPGGTRSASVSQLMVCVAAAKARSEELAGLLKNEREGG
jgi:exosome complex component RRP43